jgi:restriction system protein
MRSYYLVRLGRGGAYADECFDEGFIGVDYDVRIDLTEQLSDDLREFNSRLIPIVMAANADKTKIGAGLAGGALWMVGKGIASGDLVVSPGTSGRYIVGEVSGDYFYKEGSVLPHRRPVSWLDTSIERNDMSDALKQSTTAWGTVSNLNRYAEEIEALITGTRPASDSAASDESIEERVAFVMEKHLEDFLVQNWGQTEFGARWDVVHSQSGAGETTGRRESARAKSAGTSRRAHRHRASGKCLADRVSPLFRLRFDLV